MGANGSGLFKFDTRHLSGGTEEINENTTAFKPKASNIRKSFTKLLCLLFAIVP
jgi:hypothetical protein